MPGNGGGPEGPTACSALCSKGIFPASSRPPCTKRRLSVRLGGGYSAFSAHSCDILSYLICFPAACQEFYCQFCAPGAYWPLVEGAGGPVCRPCGFTRVHLSSGRAGGDTRPCENTGSCPVNAVGAGPRPARRSRIMFGARRRGQAPALQKTDVQKVGENLSRRAAVCQPYGFTRAHLSNGRTGGDTRPYRERRGSRFAVGAADLGGPRAHTVRPYREKKEACRVRTGAPTLGGRHCGRGKPLPYGSQESLPELGRGGPWASRRPRTSRH